MIKKVLIAVAGVLALVVVVVGALVGLRWDRRFRVPYPPPFPSWSFVT